VAFRMKDVAERAGVSTATVSHVINGLAQSCRKKFEDSNYAYN